MFRERGSKVRRSRSSYSYYQKLTAVAISFIMVLSIFLTIASETVEAKTVRVAVITDLTGDVQVKKSGGSRKYTAYNNMSLNQGDYLYTGANSGATLKLADQDAEMTIGDNAEVSLSDLATQGSGNKSKLKMFAGSVWVKVKALAGVDDEFEVETSTAVMGVRGTSFFAAVNKETGKLYLAVTGGLVATESTITSTETNESESVLVAPAQQLSVDTKSKSLNANVSTVDPNQMASEMNASQVLKLIQNLSQIAEEQKTLINNLQGDPSKPVSRDGVNTSLSFKTQEDINKYASNLNNLIVNVTYSAVQQGVVAKEDAQKEIDKANQEIKDPAQKLDITKEPPKLDPNAGLDPEAEKLKEAQRVKEEQEKAAEKQKEIQRLEALAAQLNELFKKLEEQKAQIEKLNEETKKAQEQQAQEAYKQSLSNAEKEQFEKDKAKAEEEKKNSTSTPPTTTPTTPPTNTPTQSEEPTPTPTPAPPVLSGSVYDNSLSISGTATPLNTIKVTKNGTEIGSGPVGTSGFFSVSIPVQVKGTILKVYAQNAAGLRSSEVTVEVVAAPVITPPPKNITLSINSVVTQNSIPGETFYLDVNIKPATIGAQITDVYGVELHFLKSNNIILESSSSTNGDLFLVNGTDNSTYSTFIAPDTNELIFAIVNSDGTNGVHGVDVTSQKKVVRIPLRVVNSEGSVTLLDAKVVNSNGDTISTGVDLSYSIHERQ